MAEAPELEETSEVLKAGYLYKQGLLRGIEFMYVVKYHS